MHLKPDNLFTSQDDQKYLLDRLRHGDHQAFAYLYNKYADMLLAYGSRLGFGKDILEDEIQELFYYLYVHCAALKEVNNLNYYLLRAFKNRLLQLFGTKYGNAGDGAAMLPNMEVTVLEQLIEEEDRMEIEKKIKDYLSGLTRRQREAIFLRYIKELSYEEIASILDMSVPSARNLIMRGMRKIRRHDPMFLLLYAGLFPF